MVDPGQDSVDRLQEIIRDERLKPIAVVLTHGHVDHVWSVAPVAAGYGIPAYIHHADRFRLADPVGTSVPGVADALRAMTKGALELTEPEDIRELKDGERLDLAGMAWDVLHAPGHTEGSLVYRNAEDLKPGPVLLSGDVLFAGSIGRTDLPGGDSVAMTETLRSVILTQSDNCVVLPGHGPGTSIAAERRSNPFLAGLEPGDRNAGRASNTQRRGL